MSMEAKAVLLNQLEKSLGDMLTVNQMNGVMSTLSNELSNYRLEAYEKCDLREEDYLDSFLDAMQVEGRAPKTIKRYRYIISRLYKTLNVDTRTMTVFHLRRYFADEKERGISDSTLEGVRQIFHRYFSWLQKEGLIEKNPCNNMGAIKCQKKVRLALSDTEYERLKFNCNTMRDRAIVCLLYSTGCRVSEIVGLNRDDIDLRNRECRVLGKGNKERKVFFDSVAAMVIADYLKERSDDWPALFIGKGTHRLHSGGIRLMLHRVQANAHIDTNVHPHRFRRTLATNLTSRGMPVQEVARILGHEKLDTTLKYICLDDKEIKHSYNKFM